MHTIMEIPKRNTILLKGIYFDQVQTAFDRMISEATLADDIKLDNIVDKHFVASIPTKFKSLQLWNESTKNLQIRCWHCSLPTSGFTCFVPTSMKRMSHGIEFDTHGYFCGFACAYGYLKNNAEMRASNKYIDRIHMMKILYSIITGRTIRDLYAAPPVQTLDSYGGSLEVQDYKRLICNINDRMKSESTISKVKK